MKKSILNLGEILSKTKQKEVNGGGGACPQIACYYGEVSTFTPATYCGTCNDYNALPASCKQLVLVSFSCFGA